MKNSRHVYNVYKFIKIISALAISASVFFALCAFTVMLPQSVTVGGVYVGGMAQSSAVKLLREAEKEKLKGKVLRICAGERTYEYSYPEIDFTDNFTEIAKNAKRGVSYTADIRYRLNGLNEIADYISADSSRPVREPQAFFSAVGEPFSYAAGQSGVAVDRERLIMDIEKSLAGNFEDVVLHTEEIAPEKTLEKVKKETSLLYSFTTYFDEGNVDRSFNIALAASKINGTVLSPDEVFSFNAVVGERTTVRGFRTAKIIEDGKFVSGVGGGVCQVSTTLYNAAILSGLQIEECHAHSLSVGYVPLSRDAMVSGNYCDLKFRNTRKTPVYIRAEAVGGAVVCRVYGESDGCEYSLVSEKIRSIPRPETGDGKIISYGRDGAESCAYLLTKLGDVTYKRLVRRDKYLAVPDTLETPPDS